jgi:hypothetical protein
MPGCTVSHAATRYRKKRSGSLGKKGGLAVSGRRRDDDQLVERDIALERINKR